MAALRPLTILVNREPLPLEDVAASNVAVNAFQRLRIDAPTRETSALSVSLASARAVMVAKVSHDRKGGGYEAPTAMASGTGPPPGSSGISVELSAPATNGTTEGTTALEVAMLSKVDMTTARASAGKVTKMRCWRSSLVVEDDERAGIAAATRRIRPMRRLS